MISLAIVNDYLKYGAVFHGRILSNNHDYPTIHLWVWSDGEYLYLANGITEDFRLAVTEEVEHLTDLPLAVNSIVQEITDSVSLNRSISTR